MLPSLLHSLLLRRVDTVAVRFSVRALGLGLLVCVLLAGFARGADRHEPAQPEASIVVPETASGDAGDPMPSEPAALPTIVAIDEPAAVRPDAASERIAEWMEQGNGMWRAGDRDFAESFFAAALSLDVSVEEKRGAMLELADLYAGEGEQAKAIAVLEKFLGVFPKAPETPEILIRLGLLYREIGAYGTATARLFGVLNSTLRVPPENLTSYRRLAMKARLEIADTFLAQGDFAEARKYYGRLQVFDLGPADRERVFFRGGQLDYMVDDWLKAEKQLGDFLKEYPQSAFSAEARYLRAKSLDQLGRKDEAVQEVLDLLRLQDEQDHDGKDLGQVAYWKRRTGNELANQFYEQGDFLGALSIYQALARASDEPAWRWAAVYQVGLCFERLGLASRAAEAYTLIVNPEPAPSAGTRLPDAVVTLQSMARWRLEHLDWIEDFSKRLHVLTAGDPAET